MNSDRPLLIFLRTLRNNLRNPELWGEAISSTFVSTVAGIVVGAVLSRFGIIGRINKKLR